MHTQPRRHLVEGTRVGDNLPGKLISRLQSDHNEMGLSNRISFLKEPDLLKKMLTEASP